MTWKTRYTGLTKQMKTRIERSVQLLASQTHEYIRSLAQQQLKSRKEMYLKALYDPTPVQEGIWMITLDKAGLWIEDGKRSWEYDR